MRQPLSNLAKSFTYGNGLTEANTYTLDYEVDTLAVLDGATTVVSRSHTRGDALNLSAITDNITANNTVNNYSAANRLTSGNGPWGAKSWSYDGVGNRTLEASTPSGGSSTTDVYNYSTTKNWLTSVTRAGVNQRVFTYDGAGNILTDNRSGTTTTYTYNKRNRLASATLGALVWGY